MSVGLPMRHHHALALAALVAGCASPAPAQPAHERSATERGAVFAAVSHLRSDGFYRSSGGPDADVLTLRLGAEAPVLRWPGQSGRPGPAVTVGLALQAADFSAEAFESGLRPQSAELYGRFSRPLGQADIAATAGFVLDVGPEFELDDGVGSDSPFPNSDQRDAVRLGVDIAAPAGRFRLSGGAGDVRLFPVTYPGFRLVVTGDGRGAEPGGRGRWHVTTYWADAPDGSGQFEFECGAESHDTSLCDRLAATFVFGKRR